MHPQVITSIEKIKKFLKDDLDKALLPLKTKRTPEQKRRNLAKGRWWFTIACFAIVVIDVVLVWNLRAIMLSYHIAWRTFAPVKSAAVFVGGLAVYALFTGRFAINCWRAWHEIRLEEQTSQAIPDVGVWPPSPRRD